MWLLVFSTVLLFSYSTAFSAACCGGGLSIPSIIAGDDRAQMSISYGAAVVVVDNVDNAGYWHRWENHQETLTMKIEGARIVSDRWQMGFSVPIMTRELGEKKYSGLGDVSGSLSYEYLPDWDYHPLRPKGIGFVQLNVPVSKSRVASDVGGLDSRGAGFWGLGVGTLLTKSWITWDVFSVLEWHWQREKTISSTLFQGRAVPGSGRSVSVGSGYNWKTYRLGLSLSETQEDPIELVGNETMLNARQFQNFEQWSTATLSFAYLNSEEWSYSVNYIDQTLFGQPMNTSLGKGISLQIQKRWLR